MSLANYDGTHRWFYRAYGSLCKDCGMECHEDKVSTRYFLDGKQVSDGVMPRCPRPQVVPKVIRRTPVPMKGT